jgi:deazaflavin-dependent oxidoreductase (nitroreductase family)
MSARIGARALPHVDPRAPRGVLYRAYARLVGTRPMGWLSRQIGWRLDPHLLRLSGGRLALGLIVPTALLETRGARTGRPRATAVIYFHDGERVTIIASKLGRPEHPAWFHNLRANPDVTFGGHPSAPRSSTARPNARGSGTSRTGSSPRTRCTGSEPPAPGARSRSSSSAPARSGDGRGLTAP